MSFRRRHNPIDMPEDGVMSSLLSQSKDLATAALENLGLAWLRTAGRQPGDTYLCSYPKSGRTWLRFMLSAYQVRLFKVDLKLTMANFATVSPNLTLGARMGLRTHLPHPSMKRVYGTHLGCSFLFRGARIVYLERDLRDVLVSYYHHRRARGSVPEGLDAFVLSPQGLAPAIRYLRGWQRTLANIPAAHFRRLSYEELLAAPQSGLRSCVEFLGLPVDDATLALAVRDAAADKLRLLEAATGNYDFTPEQLKANPEASHIRKARAGTYLEEMSPMVAARVEEEARRIAQGI